MDLRFASIASKARLLLCLPIALTFSAGRTQLSPEAVKIPIPVNCGDRIQAPGSYVLTQDLACSAFTDSRLPALEIAASDVHFDLQGFTFHGWISVSDVNNVKIANGKIDVVSDVGIPGITLSNVQHSRVDAVIVRAFPFSGTALSIHGGGNNLIRNSEFMASAVGVMVSGTAAGDSIVGNSIGGVGWGLFVADTVRDAMIVSNTIYNGDLGAASIRGTGLLVEDCYILGSLRVEGVNNRVRNNTIPGPDWRPLLGVSGTGNLVQGNKVDSSTGHYPADGIVIMGSGNAIRGNTSTGATPPAVDMSGSAGTCTENKWRNNTFGSAFPECIR